MMDILLIFLIWLAAIFVFVLLVVFVMGPIIRLALRGERKRSETLRPVAEELGLTFTAEPAVADVEQFAEFELFSRGWRWIGNLMRGRANDTDVSIFEYLYSTVPRSGYQRCQTVVCFESRSLNLPRFMLKPKITRYKMGIFVGVHADVDALLGLSGMDLGDHPAFSTRYHLAGEDEAAVRQVFNPSVIKHFEQIKAIHAEGSGRKLLFYRPGKKFLEPDQIGPFLKETLALYRVLRSG